jgi:hypothetical protein
MSNACPRKWHICDASVRARARDVATRRVGAQWARRTALARCLLLATLMKRSDWARHTGAIFASVALVTSCAGGDSAATPGPRAADAAADDATFPLDSNGPMCPAMAPASGGGCSDAKGASCEYRDENGCPHGFSCIGVISTGAGTGPGDPVPYSWFWSTREPREGEPCGKPGATCNYESGRVTVKFVCSDSGVLK